jgi:hypothetical protein
MYESVASDISLISVVALSFEINRLYTTTLYGSNTVFVTHFHFTETQEKTQAFSWIPYVDPRILLAIALNIDSLGFSLENYL